jgi:hypothetical protein
MKSPCQITPPTILQKGHKCHPCLEIISKVGHFQGKSFWLLAVALRLFPPLDGVFSVALQKRRATAVKVKRCLLVAEMCTLETDKPTKPSCPIEDGLNTFIFRLVLIYIFCILFCSNLINANQILLPTEVSSRCFFRAFGTEKSLICRTKEAVVLVGTNGWLC